MIPLRSTPIHHLRTGELRYSRPPPTRGVAVALGRLDVNNVIFAIGGVVGLRLSIFTMAGGEGSSVAEIDQAVPDDS